MNSPRLPLLATLSVLALPLLTGGCGGPSIAAAAVSYGADGASVASTGKTTTDHFASAVSKKDCAMWRMFRNQSICRDRDADHDPYHVNYDEPFRQQGEAGTEFGPAPHSGADAPAASWDAAAYKPAPQQEKAPASSIAAAENPAPAAEPSATEPAQAQAPTPAPVKHKNKAKKAKASTNAAKKPSQDQVASSH
jgi:hypothetical protein